MKEPDFITTISKLKEYVKEAEAAVENKALKKFVFQFLQPLRNTGCSQGIGQAEESFESLVGEIDLIRERQLKAENEERSSNSPKICKHCKYSEDNEGYAGNIGLTCCSPKTKATYKLDKAPEGGILVENDEGWGIIVSSTFGCINWEKKR